MHNTLWAGKLSAMGAREQTTSVAGYFAITLAASHPREARHERRGKCSGLRSDGKTDTVQDGHRD